MDESYYRQALVNLSEGNYPHPRSYRHKESSAGYGRCPHGMYYYEECGCCVDEYITSVLSAEDSEYLAMKKDAERYRLIRDNEDYQNGKPFICIFNGSFTRWTGESADKLVDDHLSSPHPTVTQPESNCPKSESQSLITPEMYKQLGENLVMDAITYHRTHCPKSAFDPYDTIEQQDFIQKGK
jgi:hypothetical protein